MTENEQIAIEKLNGIQIKLSSAIGRIINKNIPGGLSLLEFASHDLTRLMGFLGEAPTNKP